MHYYLGIDPGRKGGLALIDEFKNLQYVEPMPALDKGYNYEKIISLIDDLPDNTTILLELKPGVNEHSASHTTSFGFHCGTLYGICLKKHLVIVSPKMWKHEYDVFRNYKESRHDMKLRSIQAAEKYFNMKFKKNEDGMAEALLIC